jgi:hypothetical protein
MAKGDGPGGNNRSDSPPNDIGPADILLGRLILLAREGNRQAVREALGRVSEAEIVLARAAQCVRKGAMQSAIGILDREFKRVFGDDEGEGSDGDGANGDGISKAKYLVRQRRPDYRGGVGRGVPENMPVAELDLPLQVVNLLEENLGIITVGDLCKFTPEEIMACRRPPGFASRSRPNAKGFGRGDGHNNKGGLGAGRFKMIQNALAKIGLNARDPMNGDGGGDADHDDAD